MTFSGHDDSTIDIVLVIIIIIIIIIIRSLFRQRSDRSGVLHVADIPLTWWSRAQQLQIISFHFTLSAFITLSSCQSAVRVVNYLLNRATGESVAGQWAVVGPSERFLCVCACWRGHSQNTHTVISIRLQ